MANNMLDEFNRIVPTAAHKIVRSYNNTMIAGYVDKQTGQEIRLPLFPDSKHWYLSDDRLVGKRTGVNPMNVTSLDQLF